MPHQRRNKKKRERQVLLNLTDFENASRALDSAAIAADLDRTIEKSITDHRISQEKLDLVISV